MVHLLSLVASEMNLVIISDKIDRASLKKQFMPITFFYKFCPNLLNGGIDEDRALAKQSLLRWPCPLPSDRAIPVLWQNLESNV